jgi:cytochrome c peroxidase
MKKVQYTLKKTALALLIAVAMPSFAQPPDDNEIIVDPAVASDADKLLDWAESTYPQYFSTHKTTQTSAPWFYRNYVEKGILLGVKMTDKKVYVMGGPWGNVPVALGSMAVLIKTKVLNTPAARTTMTGEELFSMPFIGAGNDRSCASCHVPEDNFTLTPEHVERLYRKNPNDPLFSAIDADDPNAKVLTFDHLRKGLIRVGLTLPANMDLIDDAGKVITPNDRLINVWRSVPSIADSSFTAPYQLDGREGTLASQAQGAINGHSQGLTTPLTERQRIAAFESSIFSSDRAGTVADALLRGVLPEKIPDVEDKLVLTAQETRGREVYEQVCAACHGGVTKNVIVDRTVHKMAFPTLKPDGTVLFPPVPPDQTSGAFVMPVYAEQPNNEFINVGSAYENYLAHVDATEHVSFTKDLSFPQYRFRFYKDATRKEVVAELPPKLPRNPDFPDNPFFLAFDENGNFILGPNQGSQLYSTDPGRAAITGDPYDFEAFDIPTMRGIAKTAPYWHNNISETLEDVVELYSDHLLSKFPTLTQEGQKEEDVDGDIGPPQAMTNEQKKDLLAFLQKL